MQIRTVTEARAEGLVIPRAFEVEEPDEFLVAHDEEGSVFAWGPSWDRANLEAIVKSA